MTAAAINIAMVSKIRFKAMEGFMDAPKGVLTAPRRERPLTCDSARRNFRCGRRQRTAPAALSSTTFFTRAIKALAGRCEVKPIPA